MSTALQELDAFLEGWTVDPLNARSTFLSYRALLAAVPGVSFAPGDKCRVAAIRSTTLIVESAPIETPLQPD